MNLLIILLLIVSTVTAAYRTVQNSCPPGVLRSTNSIYLQVYGDSCFHFVFNKRRNYHQASSDCRRDGGTLALPKTKPLNDYLTGVSLNHYGLVDPLWIGLHDMRYENSFVWEDNTLMSWSNFAPGNGPDNGFISGLLEDCVTLYPIEHGWWHDFQCHNGVFSTFTTSDPKKSYICQYTVPFVGYQGDKIPVVIDLQDKDQQDKDQQDKDQQDKDQQDKDQQDKDQQDKDQQDKDQQDKDQQDKDQQDKDQQDIDQQDKDQQDKDQQDKDQQDKDQQDKDQQDKDQQDIDQQDKDQQDIDQQDKDQQDIDQQDKDQQDIDQQDKDQLIEDDDDCDKFVCDKDCGMGGYQRDSNDCQICECNVGGD